MIANTALFVAALLAAEAHAARNFQAQYHTAVQERVKELQEDINMQINSQKPPTSLVWSFSEDTCSPMWGSCNPVYFSGDNQMVKADKIIISARTHFDADVDTPFTSENDKHFDKVTVKTSKAQTDSVTKGWKVSLKLSGDKTFSDPKSPLAKLTRELAVEYGEQYTSSTTVTREVTHEKSCPPGHRCTIQTLTFHATISGTCRVVPYTNCGGRREACRGTDKDIPDTFTFPNQGFKMWEEQTCSQFGDYARKHCSKGRYEMVDCEVYAPIVDPEGKPRTSVVFTQDKLEMTDKTPITPETQPKLEIIEA